jgi:hypothetical protein
MIGAMTSARRRLPLSWTRLLPLVFAILALGGSPSLAVASASAPLAARSSRRSQAIKTAQRKQAAKSRPAHKSAASRVLKKALKNEVKARVYERKARQAGFFNVFKDIIYQMKADHYREKAKKDFERAAEIESRRVGHQ